MKEKTKKRLTAKVESPFEIELRSFGTRGFVWIPVFDSTVVRLIERRTVANRRTLGALGKERFRFCPLSKGTCEILFELKRPFNDSVKDREAYELHVE